MPPPRWIRRPTVPSRRPWTITKQVMRSNLNILGKTLGTQLNPFRLYQPIEAAVRFEEVTVERGGVSILDRVTATVPRGGCTAIIGPNGAGKTTLLLALLGEIPYQGRIHSQRQRRTVPASVTCRSGSPLTGGMPHHRQSSSWPWAFRKNRSGSASAAICKARSMEVLAPVKAEHLADRQTRRALRRRNAARAAGPGPAAGTGSPGPGRTGSPASIFRGSMFSANSWTNLRQQKGFTQLMVSHDLATVTHHATHVICLNHKVAAEGPPRQTLTSETLTAIFGMHMGLVDSPLHARRPAPSAPPPAARRDPMPDLSPLYDLVASCSPFECLQARFMQQALVGLLLLAPMAAVMGRAGGQLPHGLFLRCHQPFRLCRRGPGA